MPLINQKNDNPKFVPSNKFFDEDNEVKFNDQDQIILPKVVDVQGMAFNRNINEEKLHINIAEQNTLQNEFIKAEIAQENLTWQDKYYDAFK